MGFNVFDYYLEQNKNPNYVVEYQSTAGNKSGKTFWHINVNFRTISSFVDVFGKFVKYDNKDRDLWEVYPDNKEQKAKQMTVRMQQSKLFKKKNSSYALTEKGKAFGDFVSIVNDPRCNLNENEQWIITYYFILNSYFNLKPNYILKRTAEVFDTMKNNGLDSSYIKTSFENLLLRSANLNKEELFKLDAFWILTFFKDKDFLTLFKEADSRVKDSMASYVFIESKKPKDKEHKSHDLIGWKFVNSGQYNVSMFIDDVKTLYVTNEMLKYENSDALILLDSICNVYERFGHFSRRKVEDFIKLHYDVFEIIFNESILNKNVDTELNDNQNDVFDSDETNIPSTEKVDDTTTKTQTILRHTSQILKRMAKDRANNKCELEGLNSCRYFTAKENGKNYLEIHHLIPFEFSNDFEKSLEVLENYVALCPHCHRLLHFGVDRERRGALTYLYNQRIVGLRSKGLDIDLKHFLAYYDIND